MKVEYAIVVKNKTRLESLIERFNTKAQAKFYIERQGGNFYDYEQEHDTFQAALQLLQTRLSAVVKNKIVERVYVPSFLFADNHLVVVIGQDGLVANTAKYAQSCPIVAVNPDKQRYDGILLPFDVHNFMSGVEGVMAGRYPSRTVRFAEARLNDGQRLLAFNDLFIGAASHVSARYRISLNSATEEHSSSGIIVSTKAGATGWMSSVFNMANGIAHTAGAGLELERPRLTEEQLLFAVREPFRSIRTQTGITTGLLQLHDQLRIDSLMPANGVIFSDGVEADFLQFNSGAIVSIGVAKETAVLVEKEGK